jgi:ABC-2 type transport system ATP-binding protein
VCIGAIRARFLAPLKDAVLRNDALGIRSQSLRYTSETLKLPSVKDLFCMAVGVRTHDLRKVYNSAPPLGAAGGFIARADAKGGKQPKVQIPALDGLSLEILPGEIFGLLGPNGAGKSTTVGVLTTRVRPTSGQAWIGEHEVWKEQAQVKRLIGVVPQRPNLDFSLTAREILVFHAAYFGIGSKQRNERADGMLEKFKLTERGNQMVRGFSGGMMQRLSIARAMMHDPQVLFLDEPSAGLDPQTRILLWEIIREYHQAGKTVLLTTHNMEEADALCQRLAIVDHGHVIAVGTPGELKASIPGGFILRLRFGKQTPELLQRLQALAGVREVRAADDTGVDVYADRGGSLIPEIANLAASAGAELSDVHISEPSLENLFLHHTGRSLRD